METINYQQFFQQGSKGWPPVQGAYMLPATPHVCSTRHVDSSLLPCFQLWAPFSDNRKVNLLFILEEETIRNPSKKFQELQHSEGEKTA